MVTTTFKNDTGSGDGTLIVADWLNDVDLLTYEIFTTLSNTFAVIAPKIRITNTTNSTSVTTGSIHTLGGLGVTKDLHLAGTLRFGSPSGLTISSGVITATSSYHTVDTEAAAATDDLVTINGGSPGDVLYLTLLNNDRDTTLKDSGGNLRLAGDFTFVTGNDVIHLLFNGTNWLEVSRSTN